MSETIVSEISNWAKKHSINIEMEAILDKKYTYRDQLDYDLVFAVALSGFVSFLEQGTGPVEYLTSLIQSYFSPITDRNIKIECLTSDDDRMNAEVVLMKTVGR